MESNKIKLYWIFTLLEVRAGRIVNTLQHYNYITIIYLVYNYLYYETVAERRLDSSGCK